MNVILIYDDYQNEYDEVSLFQNTTKEKVHGFLLDVVHTINDFEFLYVSHTRPFQYHNQTLNDHILKNINTL